MPIPPPRLSIPTAKSLRRSFAHVHDVTIRYAQASPQKREEQEREREREQGRAKAEAEAEAGASMAQRNVLSSPLTLHSTRPLTGFLRTGYCEAPLSDAGNHSVAGILTDEFLDFSAARGNDLRQAGLKDGCRWCLCVARWKEAFDARTGDDDRKVPRVVLSATNRRALERVGLQDLKRFAVDADGGKEGGGMK